MRENDTGLTPANQTTIMRICAGVDLRPRPSLLRLDYNNRLLLALVLDIPYSILKSALAYRASSRDANTE